MLVNALIDTAIAVIEVTGLSRARGKATTDSAMTLGAVTLSDDATLRSGSGAVTVASVSDGAGSYTLALQEDTAGATGTVSFTGDVTVGALSTFGQGYAVELRGASNRIDTATVFANTGGVRLGDDAGDVVLFDAGLVSTASVTSTAGALRTSGDGLTLGAVVLGRPSCFV